MTSSSCKLTDIALISMPWAIFNRPSVQLGVLKAYTEQTTDAAVHCHHPYLNIAKAIGIENYTRIAHSGWGGEAVFAALLFPEMAEKAGIVFKDSVGSRLSSLPSFSTLGKIIQKTCTSWLEAIDWSDFTAAGFTICFNQLLASLYMAKELKDISPRLPIIFGGSSCIGPLGRSLAETFDYVDYIIDGEGETPLASLHAYLLGKTAVLPERVICKQQPAKTNRSPELPGLNELPIPDYHPYFAEVQALFPHQPFIPELPVEFSRGCWWNKCAFCNLNLQWQKYRWKTSTKIFQEIIELSSRHQCLDFTFTDNALPPHETDLLAEKLSSYPADFHFFAEIRAKTSRQTLHSYKEMGINSIQVGIEAISPTLLARFNKGTSVIDNIAIMKHALENDMVLDGNIITEFPGSTAKEVLETMDNLDFLFPFNPLDTAAFFLGHGSPVYCSPERYGIKSIITHRKNKALFPRQYLEKLHLLINEYRGDRTYQRKLWKPVVEKVAFWRDFHKSRSANRHAALTYRDGIDFIIIRQELPHSATLQHRLHGTSRLIYLFCDTIRTRDEITREFSMLKTKTIEAFIDQLCKKRIMFQEKDRILSLAISTHLE